MLWWYQLSCPGAGGGAKGSMTGFRYAICHSRMSLAGCLTYFQPSNAAPLSDTLPTV
jgi:hypothetical protein